jgi:Rod binding domain-containing protein
MQAGSSIISTQPPSAGAAAPGAVPRSERPLSGEAAARAPAGTDGGDNTLRQVFDAFVGETFFAQMLAAMRKTQGQPAYLYGGQAERVFQGQLDQLLAERLARSTAGQLSGKMFELFQLQRPGA